VGGFTARRIRCIKRSKREKRQIHKRGSDRRGATERTCCQYEGGGKSLGEDGGTTNSRKRLVRSQIKEGPTGSTGIKIIGRRRQGKRVRLENIALALRRTPNKSGKGHPAVYEGDVDLLRERDQSPEKRGGLQTNLVRGEKRVDENPMGLKERFSLPREQIAVPEGRGRRREKRGVRGGRTICSKIVEDTGKNRSKKKGRRTSWSFSSSREK